jgi:site-specific DNA recombinase
MAAARRRGRWIGGIPLLGYDIHPDGGKILPNKVEAKRVRQIFDLYLEKESLLDTVREMNRRGWTTKAWTRRDGVKREGKFAPRMNSPAFKPLAVNTRLPLLS